MLGQESMSWAGALGVTILVGAGMVAAGFAVLAISARAADGRLGRSRLAGIRTRATLSSDEAWSAAHQAGRGPTDLGGWLSIATGIVPLLAAAVMGLFGIGDAERYMVVWTALYLIGVAALLAAVIYGAVLGQRAAKAVQARATDD